MNIARLSLLGLTLVLISAPGAADEVADVPRFAAPKRIKAGGAFLGAGRLYPSPVLHDVNGDGRADIVVGDLFGKVTVALAAEKAAPGAESALKGGDGKPLKFSNW